MALSIAPRDLAYGSPCEQSPNTIERGLGPEFLYPFIVLFFATILRKLLRHYHISLPYTVILMLVGAVLGAFYQYELIKRLTFIADLTPAQILTIFLPILIFESAFSCDPHTFIKCLGQILTLAILGFFISVALTTLAVMYWYENDHASDVQTCWTWDQAVLYSAVVSATDPVSVVSLLKSMTSLKTLSTVIEGESLLNDAAAITIYTLVKNLIYEAMKTDRSRVEQTRATLLGINAKRCAKAIRFLIKRKITALYLTKFVLKTIAAAVFIGYIMAHITIFALYRIEGGELETCLTITMSYFVYLTCEAMEASGVIGVVLLGLTLNMHRACFSVSAIDISEQTWQLLAYVANSLIFITVGVILLKTYSDSEKMLSLLSSIPQLLLVYLILILVRALMILSLHFLLKQIAYGFTWKDAIVTIWSGLRGGVSLVLALTLFNSEIKDTYQAEIVLTHTTAIVFLTCTVNALTIPSIVHILRLDRTSELIKQTMLQIIKELQIKQNEMIRRLKRDPILATADWLFVQKAIDIQSPFDEKKDEFTRENFPSRRHIDTVKCEHCQTHVTVPISKFEFKQAFEDCRVRILRLQKTHFWSDYYNSQLSSYGLHTLNSLCDRAMDTPKQFIDLQTIQSHIVRKSRLRSFLNLIRQCTRKWQKYFPWYYPKIHGKHERERSIDHSQSQRSSRWYTRLFGKCFHYSPIAFLLILIECLIVIYQLQINLCSRLSNEIRFQSHLILEILSCVLLIFDYIQSYYWFCRTRQRNFIWIMLYTVAITSRLFSSILYLVIFIIGSSNRLCLAFYILKSLSLIQCVILVLFLITPLQCFVDYMLNRYVSVSYEIGLAYISSEEEVLRTINRLTDNESIRIRIRELSLQRIRHVLNDVLIMQEEHPGTVISIKTHHTLHLLYNTVKRAIARIRCRGVLDLGDCDLLEQALKNMRVHRHIPSTMPPASLLTAVHQFDWIFATEHLSASQKKEIEQIFLQAWPNENAKRFANEPLAHPRSFSWQDFFWHRTDPFQGVYLLVHGIVEEWKLDSYDIDAYQRELRWKESHRTRRTTLTKQQILSPKTDKHLHYLSEYDNKKRSDKKKNQNYGFTSASERNPRSFSFVEQSLSLNTNTERSDTSSSDEEQESIATDLSNELHSIDLQNERTTTSADITSPRDDDQRSIAHVRIAFEEGFYMRWHHSITGKLIPMNDASHPYEHHTQAEDNFDETFDKYREMHPATSERVHRRYSYSAGDCIGLYDFLFINGEKHETTAKCLTNVTVFFLSKEKLLHIFDTYSLWNVVWLDFGIRLALRILPTIRGFQQSSMKSRDHRSTADPISIVSRLYNAGLLLCNEMTCDSDDVIRFSEDLLLVAGSLRNPISKCVYQAPIFIERSLTKQGLKILENRSTTKILVLPKAKLRTNRDNLFTDSLLIERIMEHEMKPRSSTGERYKRSPIKVLRHVENKQRYSQTMTDTSRTLSVFDNKS